jgi:hypothetical protein
MLIKEVIARLKDDLNESSGMMITILREDLQRLIKAYEAVEDEE